ncbi:MAG: O-antigen ligase family protein [Gloeotrichia echinulata CP02]
MKNTILNLGVIVIGSLYWKRIAYCISKDKTLILLVALACLSVFWSGYIGDTFSKLQSLARSTIFGAYLAARYTIRDQMRLLSWSIIVSSILSILVCILIPSFGIEFTEAGAVWKGIFFHKQLLGRTMALGCSLFIVQIFNKDKKRWLNLSLVIIPLALILLSNSKSSLILVLLSIGILSIYNIAKQQSLVRVVISLTMILFSASIAYIIIDNLEFILVDFLGKGLELNGRVPIWTLALEKIKERYWLGYGYSAFWQSDAGAYVINNTWLGRQEGSASITAWNAHNGYIEMLVQLGIIGLGLTIIHMLYLIIKTTKLLILTLTIESLWMLEFLGFIIINNISGTMTFLSPNIFWVIHVAVSISCYTEYSRIHKNKNLTKSHLI